MGEATRGRGRARGDVAAARGRRRHWEQEQRSRGSPPGSPDAAAGPHLHFGRPAPRTVREQVSAVSSARFVGVSRNTHTRRGTTDPRSRQQFLGLHVEGTPGPRKLPGCPRPGWPAGGTERRGLYLRRSEVAADGYREAWAEAAPLGPEWAGWRRVCTQRGVSWLWGAQGLAGPLWGSSSSSVKQAIARCHACEGLSTRPAPAHGHRSVDVCHYFCNCQTRKCL